jgi:hypothetical protein
VAGKHAHPIHRDRRDSCATAGSSRGARCADPTVNLKRDYDPVAGLYRFYTFADGQDLGYTFVAEVQGQRELGRAERYGTVEIAGRGCYGVYDRAIWARRRGRRHVVEAQTSARSCLQRAHPPALRTEPLARTVAQRPEHPLPALHAVAFEC